MAYTTAPNAAAQAVLGGGFGLTEQIHDEWKNRAANYASMVNSANTIKDYNQRQTAMERATENWTPNQLGRDTMGRTFVGSSHDKAPWDEEHSALNQETGMLSAQRQAEIKSLHNRGDQLSRTYESMGQAFRHPAMRSLPGAPYASIFGRLAPLMATNARDATRQAATQRHYDWDTPAPVSQYAPWKDKQSFHNAEPKQGWFRRMIGY